MTSEQTLLRLLNLKWPQHRRECVGCGKRGGNWEVADTVQWMPFNGRNEIVIGGPCVPMVVVCCAECGWTMLWSAVRLGLFSNNQPPQGEVLLDRTGSLPQWQQQWMLPSDTKA
jgi:hypothetical protein